MSDKTEVDVALAEYGSLRQEIDTRATRWHQILTTQLIVTGAIFAYALGPGESRNILVLLVLPFTSFLLLGRLADQQYAINRIGRYVRVYLSPRVPGGLQWEKWAYANRRRQVRQFWSGPTLLAFPGASWLAIGFHAGAAYAAHEVSVVLVVFWAAGIVSAGCQIVMVILAVRDFNKPDPEAETPGSAGANTEAAAGPGPTVPEQHAGDGSPTGTRSMS